MTFLFSCRWMYLFISLTKFRVRVGFRPGGPWLHFFVILLALFSALTLGSFLCGGKMAVIVSHFASTYHGPELTFWFYVGWSRSGHVQYPLTKDRSKELKLRRLAQADSEWFLQLWLKSILSRTVEVLQSNIIILEYRL